MRHQLENGAVKDAAVSSTVIPPNVNSAETENLTRNPRPGDCHWCKRNPGDIYCDDEICCWDCLEAMLDREQAIYMNRNMASLLPLPMEWE